MFHSRQAFANAFTVVLTTALLLLIGFAVNAQAAVTPGEFDFASCPTGKPYAGSKRAPLAVGFVTDQFQVAKYQRKVGTRNRLGFYSNFEAWAKNRDPRQAFQQGNLNRVLPYVTWEPWENVPNDANQSQPQPAWTNAAIASGAHDDYIRQWAAAVKANGRPIYLRLAHEMNGTSYPWSLDPQSYVAAWQHVVTLFREAGARNARFVFSVNANTYQSRDQWCAGFMQYWPGAEYVDAVGMTTIQFGGPKARNYTVANFAKRIAVLRRLGKPIHLSEANAEYKERVKWFRDLGSYVSKSPWVEALIVSQAPSRAVGLDGVRGNMTWDIRKDAPTLKSLKDLMRDRPLLGRSAKAAKNS